MTEITRKLLCQEYHIDEGKCVIVHNGVDYDFWDSTKVESTAITPMQIAQPLINFNG